MASRGQLKLDLFRGEVLPDAMRELWEAQDAFEEATFAMEVAKDRLKYLKSELDLAFRKVRRISTGELVEDIDLATGQIQLVKAG